MDLNKDIINLLAGACIIIGALSCFYGYRIFKFILGLLGFLIVGFLSAAIGFHYSMDMTFTLLVGFLGGLIGAAVMVPLYFVGVFINGFIFGGLLGGIIYVAAQINPDPAAILILAVIGGVISVILEKFMIILSTSFKGAALLLFGLAYFSTSAINFYTINQIQTLGTTYIYALLVGWLAIGTFGMLFQLRKPENNNTSAKSGGDRHSELAKKYGL